MAQETCKPLKDIDDLFNRYTRAIKTHRVGSHEVLTICDWSPIVDVAETDNTFVIRAQIFEINKEDIKVSLENGILTILGEKKVETESRSTKHHRYLCPHESFSRSFTLPDNLDKNTIKASFNDGILILYIQKLREKKYKTIEILVS